MTASRYWSGRGVAKDASKAVHWWKAAAELGDAHAQLNLGMRSGLEAHSIVIRVVS
jgi:TPR repeat protein